MAKKIRVVSRQIAESRDWPNWWKVISITDPGSANAKINGVPGENLLRLSFTDDVSEGPNAVLMNMNQARAIAKFVKNGDMFLVHCEAGISRSAGVADALRAFGFEWINENGKVWSIDEGWISQFHPNVHVKTTLMRAMFLV